MRQHTTCLLARPNHSRNQLIGKSADWAGILSALSEIAQDTEPVATFPFFCFALPYNSLRFRDCAQYQLGDLDYLEIDVEAAYFVVGRIYPAQCH